jgi:hypothetical protein
MSRQMLLSSVAAIFLIAAALAHAQQPGDCGYYTNSGGHEVPRPCGDAGAQRPPLGATAICRDGTFSFSENPHAGGTCSHHGGLASHLR